MGRLCPMTSPSPAALLLALTTLSMLLSTGCTDESLALQASVELENRTGFTVEVYVGDTLKVSRLPNGGTAEFETRSGRRPILVRDLATGLTVVEEQYRFDDEAINVIELEDARSKLTVEQSGDCCVRVFADGRQVAELGGLSTREVLIPAGTRPIQIRSCTGVIKREESRVFLPGGTTTVETTSADCD